jgi:hypothetical protein
MTDQTPEGRRWIEEAEEALSRTGDALRAAWEGSRDARMSALEAAREAATGLGQAIDRGVEAARDTLKAAKDDRPDETPPGAGTVAEPPVESPALDPDETE